MQVQGTTEKWETDKRLTNRELRRGYYNIVTSCPLRLCDYEMAERGGGTSLITWLTRIRRARDAERGSKYWNGLVSILFFFLFLSARRPKVGRNDSARGNSRANILRLLELGTWHNSSQSSR